MINIIRCCSSLPRLASESVPWPVVLMKLRDFHGRIKAVWINKIAYGDKGRKGRKGLYVGIVKLAGKSVINLT